MKRTVVFSHEELLSGMAEVPDKLEVNILVASYQEMKKSVVTEEERRQAVCAKVSLLIIHITCNVYLTILVEAHL